MYQQTIATTMTPEIFIDDVGGDLQIKGWDRPEINIKANQEELTLQQDMHTVHLSCTGSIALRVPEGAAVKIDSVHGEARLKLLEEPLQISMIGGSLVMRSVGEVKAGSVHGGLVAKSISGSLLVDQVFGDAVIRNVEGDCLISQVMGDLVLRHCEGSVTVQSQGGIRVRLGELNGDVDLKANGSLICHLPEDASAKIEAEGPDIKISLGDEKIKTEGSFSTVLDDSQYTVSLSALGSLVVHTWEGGRDDDDEHEHSLDDFGHLDEAFNQEISRQIEAQVEAMTRQINDQIASISAHVGRGGFSPEKSEEIMRRARETSERATVRAQERMRKAQERLEQKMEAAHRRAEERIQAKEKRHQSHRAGTWRPTWPTPPTPPMPPKEPVSEDERLMILRMLEQKKITIEEAEQLLSALDGE